jgi:hypothetical protein
MEEEVKYESVHTKFAYTDEDRIPHQFDYYNLDVIISVGYGIKFLR